MTQLRNVLSAVGVNSISLILLFRPVDMTTAPDGTMYITDMYDGIIQESQWSGPGTSIRATASTSTRSTRSSRQGPYLAVEATTACRGAPT